MGSYTSPIQNVYDPLQIRYKLYGDLCSSDARCIRPNTDPIQTVQGPLQIRYRPYTDPTQTVHDPLQIRYTLCTIMYRPDTHTA